ncbi:MAG TPA: transcriptional repressor [Victivallales bacterium]|nr:transcriptional repressor [Victivallales bacterium]
MKKKRERQTKQKRIIEELIKTSKTPLSVDEILCIGRKKLATLNRATVYRNLNAFIPRGELKKIKIPFSGTFYEGGKKDHHHNFLCLNCKKVYDIPGCHLKKNIRMPKGFNLQKHEIFFYGICEKCNIFKGKS